MKVIFLDKDGVLNSDEYFDSMKWLYTDGVESDVDIEKVKLLKKAVDETGAADNPGTEDFVILDDEIFPSYDESLMKKLIKISTGNGKGFGDGLQRSDVDQIVQRLERIKQKDDDDLVL